MVRKSKNTLADEKYGCDFDELTGGEKAGITKKYNAQPASSTRRATRRTASAGAVKAEVGRVGVNGVKSCLLEAGATVQDLLDQADIELDTKKEGVLAQSTGASVQLTTKVKNGEIYMIAPEIKSA